MSITLARGGADGLCGVGLAEHTASTCREGA